MGVDHPNQERGLAVKYHPTNNYVAYSHRQHTSVHIQNAERIYPFVEFKLQP